MLCTDALGFTSNVVVKCGSNSLLPFHKTRRFNRNRLQCFWKIDNDCAGALLLVEGHGCLYLLRNAVSQSTMIVLAHYCLYVAMAGYIYRGMPFPDRQ